MTWGDPDTALAGQKVTADFWNRNVRDNLKAIGDPWQSWSPALTSSGTAPTFTSDGGYIHAGRDVRFWFEITITTPGTGNYTFSMPVAAAAYLFPSSYVLVDCWDSSAGSLRPLHGFTVGSTTQFVASDSAGARVSATSPFTFAEGDKIAGHGFYEAAAAA